MKKVLLAMIAIFTLSLAFAHEEVGPKIFKSERQLDSRMGCSLHPQTKEQAKKTVSSKAKLKCSSAGYSFCIEKLSAYSVREVTQHYSLIRHGRTYRAQSKENRCVFEAIVHGYHHCPPDIDCNSANKSADSSGYGENINSSSRNNNLKSNGESAQEESGGSGVMPK